MKGSQKPEQFVKHMRFPLPKVNMWNQIIAIKKKRRRRKMKVKRKFH